MATSKQAVHFVHSIFHTKRRENQYGFNVRIHLILPSWGSSFIKIIAKVWIYMNMMNYDQQLMEMVYLFDWNWFV